MIIHPHIPKRKKRKPNAKQRALQASWQEILKKYETKTVVSNKKISTRPSTTSVIIPANRDLRLLPSLDSGRGVAVKPSPKVYTGDAMMGIATMHKSNSVPVFRQDDAKAISQMRRN